MKSARVLANSAIVDHVRGRAIIDGIEFPFYLEEHGPVVEQMGFENVAIVSLPVLVAGTVVQRFQDRPDRVFDPEFGDVGEYARRFVREALVESFPWLEVGDE